MGVFRGTIGVAAAAFLAAIGAWGAGPHAAAQELTSQEVVESIERGKRFLISQQRADGSFSSSFGDRMPVGVTSLATLALLSSGMTTKDEPVRKALGYLRSVEDPRLTYEASLLIMVFVAAKEGNRDLPVIRRLARALSESQVKTGNMAGTWNYGVTTINIGGDRSNGQFAVLGLREAQHAGVPVDRKVWELARDHWVNNQSADGGWDYSTFGGGSSTGSMTVAGIATLVIVNSMLRDPRDENPDGTPNCCGAAPDDAALQRGVKWLEKRFAVGHNPGANSFLLYYLYGMERAGRFSGRRFFGDNDWYRAGAAYLIKGQARGNGSWRGDGLGEDDPTIGTSLALLFLSKGLSPVLINKLKYGARGADGEPDPASWSPHRDDVRNLTDVVSGLPKWPRLVTWQEVDLLRAVGQRGVGDLGQAPVAYMSGALPPDLSDAEVQLLRDYVLQGGFVFADAACTKTPFDAGFRDLVRRMFPEGDYPLKRLTAEHPVFRSEYLLDPETTELWGVDVGCRTGIVYSPHDLGCLWNKWSVADVPGRSVAMKAMITKAVRVGVNVVAYATGREPANKLDQPALLAADGVQDEVERGFLQVAKLRHAGGWDAAPQAVRHLLMALNAYGGTSASTKIRNITATDPNLSKYPLLYMHGRNQFTLAPTERDKLREYLRRGGVLFADSCCGSAAFDRSFRELMAELFPERKFDRIPVEHEIFTDDVGHDIRRVKRRELAVDSPDAALETQVVETEPYLEGIEIDGRYVVIYSKYDLSCAIERQATVVCSGYLHDDAVRIAVNVVRYALLQ